MSDCPTCGCPFAEDSVVELPPRPPDRLAQSYAVLQGCAAGMAFILGISLTCESGGSGLAFVLGAVAVNGVVQCATWWKRARTASRRTVE